MSDIAIRVEGLGKEYVIDHQENNDLKKSLGDRLKFILGRNSLRKESFWALKDISFNVEKGQAVGIIGRNGAGKSTLLKIISRIAEPTRGRFEINGRVSSLLEVGTGFHPELSGRENIYLNGTILGMRRAEIKTKFDAIVEFSGVEKFIDTPVKHYSSGMKVRLAFSVAAHLEPEILIVDEVLAVGDAEFQKKCLGKMDEVTKNDGRTILFVSHNMGAVETLCSKAIVLNNGTIGFEGNVSESIKYYFHESHSNNQQNYQPFFIDLSNHHNKIYKKNYGLQTATVYVNGEKTNIVSPGNRVDIDFTYILEEKPHNPVLGIVIKDSRGEAIIGVNNKHTGEKFFKGDLAGKVRFTIDKFAAYGSGQFYVDLYLGEDGGDDYDIIKEAFCFELVATDIYKTGVFVHLSLNKIYQPLVSFSSIN